MPIYEFRCEMCGLVIDQRLPVELRDVRVECESCGSLMRRLRNLPMNGFEPTRVKHRFDDKLEKNRERAEEMGY